MAKYTKYIPPAGNNKNGGNETMTAQQYCKKTYNSNIPVVWVDCTHRELTDDDYVTGVEMERIQQAKVLGHEIINGIEFIYLDIFFKG